MNTYFKLQTKFYEDGRITANISTVDMEGERPKAISIDLETMEVYEEYYDTHSEAMFMLETSNEDYTMV